MKAAIYARVSTEEQNIQTQLDICREYCARNNLEIYGEFCDNGVPGMKTGRPALNTMLEDMRRCKFSCIVVTKLDRIGRSLQHLLAMVDEFNTKGVVFISATQSINTNARDPVGRLTLQMFGAFSEFERNLISERTKEGLRRAKNVGKRGKDKRPRKLRGNRSKRIEY